MTTTKKTLDNIRANGYDIDFGTVFNNAFEVYKKIALQAGLAILLMTIFICIAAGLLAVGVIGVAISMESLEQFKVENMSILWLVAYIFCMILFGALTSPIHAGLIKMAQDAYQGDDYSVSTVFDYYRSVYFKEIVTATVVITFFSTVLSVGLQWVGFQWLGVIMSLSISVLTFLTIPLIIFGDLKAMEAIEGSILVVSKQFLILFALIIVATIFICLGIFGFCIGIFFTLPLIYALYYTIYREIFGNQTQTIATETSTLE
jgi:hypothetical protein